MDDQAVDALFKLQEWHQKRVENLRKVIDYAEAGIKVESEGKDIELNKDRAAGVRMGVLLCLEQLGKLPFSIRQSPDDEEE